MKKRKEKKQQLTKKESTNNIILKINDKIVNKSLHVNDWDYCKRFYMFPY